MKKLAIFIISLFFVLNANALSVNLQDIQTFFPGAGVKDLLAISVNIESDNEITKDKWFSLIIPNDANIRFANNLTWLSITWIWVSKLVPGATIMPNLKVIKFTLNSDLKKWENLSISWLKIIVYNKSQWWRSIWIDTNADGLADFQTLNTIRVDSTYSYSDQLAPSEVFNLTWSLINNILTLSADMPWDLDFQWVQIDNLMSNWIIKTSFFRQDLNNFSYTMPDLIDKIRIRTVDEKANYSSGYIFNQDYFKLSLVNTWTTLTWATLTGTITSTWVDNSVMCIQVLSYAINPVTNICETFSTPCEIPSNFKKVEKCVQEVSKYVWNFSQKNKVLLNRFTQVIDSFIVKKLNVNATMSRKNDATIIRNYIVKLLEDYDEAKTKAEKKIVVNNIAVSIKDLMYILK